LIYIPRPELIDEMAVRDELQPIKTTLFAPSRRLAEVAHDAGDVMVL